MAGERVYQHTLTVVARVVDLPRARRGVEEAGAPVAAVVPGTAPQPTLFAEESLRVHFGRVVLIEESPASPFSSWLVLESNFDSSEVERDRAVSAHLDALVSARGESLVNLFAGCAGMQELRQGLEAALAPSTAEYQGHVGRDISRIRIEAAAHDAALRLVSTLPAGLGPEGIRERVRDELARLAKQTHTPLAGLDWSLPPPAFPDMAERQRKLHQTWGPWIENGLRVFGGTPALGVPVLGGLLPLWATWLGYAALRGDMGPEFNLQLEAEHRDDADFQRLEEIERTEDHGMHNPLTHLVPLKTGLIGSATLRLLHRYIALMAKNYFDDVEQLGGIPSIHFAKWLLIDEGRRLLFFSNYDGSWESYLGDFVDQAAIGLNLAWCLTEGYPKTQWFASGGAQDEERFKAWARAYQRPTQIFYSAYPTLSLSAINNNTWLCHGLHGGSRVDEEWVRRLT